MCSGVKGVSGILTIHFVRQEDSVVKISDYDRSCALYN